LFLVQYFIMNAIGRRRALLAAAVQSR
jgi:hypothetical protein